MRRTLILALAAVTALALASVAVATLRTAGISATTATFSAAKNRTDVRTCTGDGDTYQITHGLYVGTIDFASPNDALDGPVALHINSALNQTDNIGWVQGWFRVKDDVNDQDVRHAQGHFWGTIDASGHIDGFIQGRVNRRLALLAGGMSATFTPDGGFVGGKIGSADFHNPAAMIGRPCKDSKPVRTPIAVRLAVRGEVSAIDAGSITVNPRDGSPAQTCTIVSGKSPSTDGVGTGTKVQIGCALVDGQMTLLQLHKR